MVKKVDNKDLNFVFYGIDVVKENGKIVTAFNPFIVTASEFIKMQENECDSQLIRRMKLGNFW